MTNEDKDLLVKDLCARLPYGVIVEDLNCTPSEAIELSKYCMCEEATVPELILTYADNIKPYLRPMSSMTEKEKLDYIVLGDIKRYTNPQYAYLISEQLDYLNAHHFDYRGLIEKGLALEAPERMYNIE